jgi:hypothetical protein
LNEQIKADAERQQLAKERQYRARKRANSETTEVPVAGDTPTETFSQEMEINGVRFNTVKIFHPRIGENVNRCPVITISNLPHIETLGTMYMADPICDDINATLPLELYVITFESHYYTTSQGKIDFERTFVS